MKVENVWVSGTGKALGQLQSASAAVECGRFPKYSALVTDMESVSISDRFPTELAIDAAAQALLSNPARDKISLHIFCNTTYSGRYMWPASHNVISTLVSNFAGPSLSCNAQSSTSTVALEIAATMMCGNTEIEAALITAGDNFALPLIDRWNHDPDIVFGDGGGAVVLTKDKGWARIMSVASCSLQNLEGLHRGNDSLMIFTETSWPVAQRRRYRDFFASSGMSLETLVAFQRDAASFVMEKAVSDAGIKQSDLKFIIPPFVGREMLEREFSLLIDFGQAETLNDFGRTIGHLGGCDHLVALDVLKRGDNAASGDLIGLLGMGAGQTWTMAILEVT